LGEHRRQVECPQIHHDQVRLLARLRRSSDPTSSPSPIARAPPIVAIRSTSQAGIRAGSRTLHLLKRAARIVLVFRIRCCTLDP
jgi:hypothetical protein